MSIDWERWARAAGIGFVVFVVLAFIVPIVRHGVADACRQAGEGCNGGGRARIRLHVQSAGRPRSGARRKRSENVAATSASPHASAATDQGRPSAPAASGQASDTRPR